MGFLILNVYKKNEYVKTTKKKKTTMMMMIMMIMKRSLRNRTPVERWRRLPEFSTFVQQQTHTKTGTKNRVLI